MSDYPGTIQRDHPRANSQGMVRTHILVAEAALGKYLPPAAEVHHINEIRSDYRNSNLVICENRKYHRILHARARIQRGGGNPDKDKICCQCHATLNRARFASDRKTPDGLNAKCRSCDAERKLAPKTGVKRLRKDSVFVAMPDGDLLTVTDVARRAGVPYRRMYERLFVYRIPVLEAMSSVKLRPGTKPGTKGPA